MVSDLHCLKTLKFTLVFIYHFASVFVVFVQHKIFKYGY